MSTRKFRIKIDGKLFEAEVEEIGGEVTQQSITKTQASPKEVPFQQSSVSSSGSNSITAPMPGKIIAVKVSKGQQVKDGDVVLILEAMKMEQEIKSSLQGTVNEILVSSGDTVKKDQALITIG